MILCLSAWIDILSILIFPEYCISISIFPVTSKLILVGKMRKILLIRPISHCVILQWSLILGLILCLVKPMSWPTLATPPSYLRVLSCKSGIAILCCWYWETQPDDSCVDEWWAHPKSELNVQHINTGISWRIVPDLLTCTHVIPSHLMGFFSQGILTGLHPPST